MITLLVFSMFLHVIAAFQIRIAAFEIRALRKETRALGEIADIHDRRLEAHANEIPMFNDADRVREIFYNNDALRAMHPPRSPTVPR